MQEIRVWFLGREDPLEKTAIHSSILAWRFPWTEDPGRLQPTGSQRVTHDWSNLACMQEPIVYHRKWSKVKSLSHVQLFVTPWTVAYQAPPFTGFSRQEYWSGLPFPSPGDLPNPEIEPGSLTFQAGVLPSEPPRKSEGTLLNTL